MSTTTHQRHFLRLAQYNTWFNGQLYGLVEPLDAAERTRDLGAFFGSIQGTLEHILLVDRIWLGRIQRSTLPFLSLDAADLVYEIESLGQGIEADFPTLRTKRRETDAVLEAFVRELSQELLERDLEYKNTKKIDFCHPLWHVVAHTFNHGTHHRGQVTTLLRQIGVDPGVTDFMITAMMPLEDA